jgi:hypothetical protein
LSFKDLVELNFVQLFLEYPVLIFLAVILLPLILFVPRYYRSRFDYHGNRGLRLWTFVAIAYIAVVICVSPLAYLFYRCWGMPAAFNKTDIGIVVAEIPGQADRVEQTAYQIAIMDRVKQIDQLKNVVKVRLLERPLPPDAESQQAEALEIGRWLNAAFILRPFSVQGVQEPRLTVVKYWAFFKPDSRLGTFSTKNLAQLEQMPLPTDLTLLVQTFLALALTEQHSFQPAAELLKEVLHSPHLPEATRARWAITLLYADDLAFARRSDEAVAGYRGAISLKPDSAVAYCHLAGALMSLGESEEADRALSRALFLFDKGKQLEQVSFGGGDGSDIAHAVVVHNARREVQGIVAEQAWLRCMYFGGRHRGQALISDNGRSYDKFNVTGVDGEPRTAYFDITNWFGKW